MIMPDGPDPLLLDFVRALAKADARRDRMRATMEREETCRASEQQCTPGSQRTCKANDPLTIRSPFAGSSQSSAYSKSPPLTQTKPVEALLSSEGMAYSASWKMPGRQVPDHIVEALDRLSRDQEDLAGLHKRLSFAGVQIVAVHDGAADAIQIGISWLVSTLFLADLKHKIRRGMTGVVRDGRHAGGRAYGYRPTPGQPGVMQIHQAEAGVVRRVFDEIIEGRRPREIAAGLNMDGIEPPRGLNWNASTINGSAARGNGMIRDPLYAGRIVWNRVQMMRDPDTGKRVSRINPESEHRTTEARPTWLWCRAKPMRQHWRS